MGLFHDRNTGFPVNVNLNLDEAILRNLNCQKTAVTFVCDFVERCPLIQRIVLFSGSERGLNNENTDHQIILKFEIVADANIIVGGLPLQWIDCCTQFIDLTPQGTAAGNYIVRMQVFPPAAILGQQVYSSLLV